MTYNKNKVEEKNGYMLNNKNYGGNRYMLSNDNNRERNRHMLSNTNNRGEKPVHV